MRPQRSPDQWVWVRNLAAAVAAALTAAALAVRTVSDQWALLIGVFAVAAFLVTVSAWIGQRRAERRAQLRGAETLFDADPHDLGVDFELGPHELEGRTWRYVDRDDDDDIRMALRAAHDGTGPSIVVVAGRTKLGKTRSLYEAACRELMDNPLVAPKDVAALRARMQDRASGPTGA